MEHTLKVCVCRSRLDQWLCQACPTFIPFDENDCAVENSFSFLKSYAIRAGYCWVLDVHCALVSAMVVFLSPDFEC